MKRTSEIQSGLLYKLTTPHHRPATHHLAEILGGLQYQDVSDNPLISPFQLIFSDS